MPTNRNIPLLYWISFCHSFILASTIERLYWQSRGMTVAMVVACEILYAVAIVACEIPSGVLADLLGRKAMLIIGAALAFVETALLLFAGTFWHFALAVLLTGIGGACTSGAWNALLYDTLALSGREDQFERTVGRMSVMDAVGVILAGLLGGYLAQRYGLTLPYRLSLISTGAALALTLLLAEPPRHGGAPEANRAALRDVLARGARFFRQHTNVLAVMLHAASIAALIIYVDEFWQLYLAETGFPVMFFGLVLAAFMLSHSGGALLADRLRRRLGTGVSLLLLSWCAFLGLLAAALSHSLLGLAGMLLAYGASGAMQVLAAGYVHRRADQAARATIESVGQMLQRLFVIAAGLVFAYVAERFSLVSSYAALAALAFAICAWFTIVYRKKGMHEKGVRGGDKGADPA